MEELKVAAEIKRGRVAELMREPVVRGFLWGLGSAVAASYLWPKVRGSVRPLLVGAVSEVMKLADGAMETAAHWKEDFEDLVAEAKQQKEQPQAEMQATGEAGSEVSQLKDTVQQLQQKFAEMDQVRGEVHEIKRLLRQIADQATQSTERA